MADEQKNIPTVGSKPVAVPSHKNSKFVFFKKLFGSVPIEERVNFARHLSFAIKSGIPVIESLKLIQDQSSSKKLGKIINQVINDVNNGQFLAQSLEKFDYIFGDLFINMVRVGETSGNLSETLLHLSKEIKKQREINNRIKSAFVYPSIILCATIGMTVFLTTVIFPKILPIFSNLKVGLPFTTRAVIAILNFLNHYGIVFLGGVILVFVLFQIALMFKPIRYVWDKLMLALPIVSKMIKNLTMANFTRSLGILLKSGMTVVDGLAISKNTVRNKIYQFHIEKIIETVRQGESLAHYLKKAPKLFPKMFLGMIKVGEETGNLEENLTYLSEYYSEELDNTVKNLTTLLEPILILLMGLVVGFIALSIIMPIYSITQGISG
ncbi:MAG: type II secretion system F family protein [Patescibacteria group bacterium]